MPKEWTDKDERQYEHVKESEAKEGRSPKRAKAIAAATVNKQRSKEGRTKTSSASTTRRSSSKATNKKPRRRAAKR